jgi:hypothetical protein
MTGRVRDSSIAPAGDEVSAAAATAGGAARALDPGAGVVAGVRAGGVPVRGPDMQPEAAVSASATVTERRIA